LTRAYAGHWRTAVNDTTKTEHITRESIMRLLSDDEVASVCTAETKVRPLEGEEYLDLDNLDQGVRSALGTSPNMSRLLLRRSVHGQTWNKILKLLVALHPAPGSLKS
jgi:hypothetical protein